MKRFKNRRILIAVFVSNALLLMSCSRGDHLGPIERTARAIMGKWDMWVTASVRPYEEPMPGTPLDTVPIKMQETFSTVRARFEAQDETSRKSNSERSFRRYCMHCHGSNLDGRTIVGESFSPQIPDLRHRLIQAKSDEVLYQFVMKGSKHQLPLRDTVTSYEAVAAIAYLRDHARSYSYPYFQPKNVERLR